MIDAEPRLQPVIPRSQPRDAWLALLLAAITLAVFCPVLRHHFIETFDDKTAILTNPAYNPPRWMNLLHFWVDKPNRTFYVPVTYTLWGLLAMVSRGSAPPGLPFNPAYFYAANLICHAACAAMVFLILARFVTARWAAWFGAALFALHPLQVESVANAWSVYTSLSGAFGFLAVLQYLIFSDRWAAGNRVAGRRSYAWATAAYLLAMLSKPTAISIPLMIIAIEIGQRGRDWQALVRPLMPWVVVGAALVLLSRNATPSATVTIPPEWLLPAVPLDAIAFYLGKLLVPDNLVMDYGRSPQWAINHPGIVWLTGLSTVVIFAAAWRLRRRIPWLLTGLCVFVAGMVTSVGLVPFDFQHYSTVADRYVYLSMLGPALMIAFLLRECPRMLASIIATGVIGILAALCIGQLRHWQDDWQMAAYTLDTNPQSKAALASFVYLTSSRGHPEGPGQGFPASRNVTLDRTSLVRAGDLLDRRTYPDLAAELYESANRMGPPDWRLYKKAGAAWAKARESAKAIAACQEALKLNPGDAEAHAIQGNVFVSENRIDEAVEQFRLAMKLSPDDAGIRRCLDNALRMRAGDAR